MATRARLIVGPASMVLFVAVSSTGVGSCNYAGPDYEATCLTCHDGQTASYGGGVRLSAHAGVACVVCHEDAAYHVTSRGQFGYSLNPAWGPYERSYSPCLKCHYSTVGEFLGSVHAASESVACHDCHEVHAPCELVVPAYDNGLCLECHARSGYGTDQDVAEHTKHSVDPSGTGASRCTACHMPPVVRVNQDDGPHDHTFATIPPGTSADAARNGVDPVLPNSCAGIAGCHDGTVADAPVLDVDDPDQMEGLDRIVDLWFSSS